MRGFCLRSRPKNRAAWCMHLTCRTDCDPWESESWPVSRWGERGLGGGNLGVEESGRGHSDITDEKQAVFGATSKKKLLLPFSTSRGISTS